MDKEKSSQLFLSLIYSFQMQSMMHLGKIVNPVTNKTEKDLDSASMTIDMLEMLQEKTKGNISDDETKFLSEALTNLRLNFTAEKLNPSPNVEDNKVEEKPDEGKKE
jgi:hypothetical protein